MQASPGGHDAHAPPPVPHALTFVPVSQFPLASQQPSGQVMGLQPAPWQAPPVHVSPVTHVPQAFPPAPQAPLESPGSQFPAGSQQPGHVSGPHFATRQLPFAQRLPGGQAEHEPPPSPHSEGAVPGWQSLFMSQQPPGHVSGLHVVVTEQVPSVQRPPGPHFTHASPPVPQLRARVPARHVPSAPQQPGQFSGPQGFV
jgi:hypothetical protein